MATRYEETGIRMVTLANEETVGKHSFRQPFDPDSLDKVQKVLQGTELLVETIIGRSIFKLRGAQGKEGLWTLYCHERMQDQVILWRYTGTYTHEAMRQFAAGWEVIYTAR